MTAPPLPDPPLADDLVRLRPWAQADVHAAFRATQDALIQRFTRPLENQTGQRGVAEGRRALRVVRAGVPRSFEERKGSRRHIVVFSLMSDDLR